MDILATGMGWINHTPGGLNRYFADYLEAMAATGHTVRGLVTAHGEDIIRESMVENIKARIRDEAQAARARP